MKITAMHGGGDWYDASADYVVLPPGMDIDKEIQLYNHWVRKEYNLSVKYMRLVDWVISRGGRLPTEDELEIVDT